mmetsp:Transcript_840/g.3494  ORF Transcript_840/g.3494 Transcript_840/m.3494 type:complete len:248 (-) Transcript_840:172-915(-)
MSERSAGHFLVPFLFRVLLALGVHLGCAWCFAAFHSEAVWGVMRLTRCVFRRESHLQKKIQTQTKVAREKMKVKDKRGAIFALKRKKLFEKDIEKIDGARFNLEQQIAALEGAAVNMEIFQGMRAAGTALSSARAGVDVDGVDDAMADVQEELGIHQEISDAISRPMDDGLDDEELLREFEEFEEANLESELLDVPDTATAQPAAARPTPDLSSLPAVPSSAVQVEGGADDAELAELRALEASMLAS